MNITKDTKEKTLLYVYGVFEELHKSGYMDMEGSHIAPKGVAKFDQITAEGWKPSTELLTLCLKEVFDVEEDQAGDFIKLIELWQKGQLV